MESQSQTGILEIYGENKGRLRTLDKTLIALNSDPVVPGPLIQRWGLRGGLQLEVRVGKTPSNGQGPSAGGNYQGGKKHKNKHPHPHRGQADAGASGGGAPTVTEILTVEGQPPANYASVPSFENLTTIDPQPRLTLEYPGCPPACRLIDLFCPIGYGQRGMIVSPPKAGKTTLLQQIAFSAQKNHANVEVIALLIDERPEEVTDFRRNVPCTVLASSNDHDSRRHVNLAMLAIERAKRKAESGKDVLVLLDSLTRVGRAFNVAPGIAQSG
ncbi:MAG: hypothetical protein IT442_12740, partial [Phycisphaeraceae bacterium]|nr:hypothetical protein [Phycisphaeraceae bacterium]